MNGIKRDARRVGPRPRLAAIVGRAARRLANLASEVHYANRRSTELFLTRAADLPVASRPARTYDEFLARTSGRLVHEPSASARLGGHHVR
jgi:hypothetical protein